MQGMGCQCAKSIPSSQLPLLKRWEAHGEGTSANIAGQNLLSVT